MLPLSPSLLPSLAAACLYAAATFYQGSCLRQGTKANKRLLVTLGILAVIVHAASLYTHLLSPAGLELDFFSAASLIAVAVIIVTLIACARIPVENLLLLLYPLGMLTVLLSEFAPAGTVQIVNEEPGILLHILLSILAYGMFTIAVFQALLSSSLSKPPASSTSTFTDGSSVRRSATVSPEMPPPAMMKS